VPADAPPRRTGGRAGDIDHAIYDVLDRLYPRRFSGYGVTREPAPDRGEIRSAVIGALPSRLASSVDDGTLDAHLDRAMPNFQWPFARLLDGA
jgi:hypothetical protein